MSDHTVLIVDDEPNFCHVLTRMLRKKGYTALSASSGPEALEIIENQNPDVVVSDLRMPGMDGVALTRHIKARYPDKIVIALTGYASFDSLVDFVREGCDDFLVKPLDSLQLLAMSVERCLAKRRALQEAAIMGQTVRMWEQVVELIREQLEHPFRDLAASLEYIDRLGTAGDAEEIKELLRLVKRQADHACEVIGGLQGITDPIREKALEMLGRGSDTRPADTAAPQ